MTNRPLLSTDFVCRARSSMVLIELLRGGRSRQSESQVVTCVRLVGGRFRDVDVATDLVSDRQITADEPPIGATGHCRHPAERRRTRSSNAMKSWLDFWNAPNAIYVSRRHQQAHYDKVLSQCQPFRAGRRRGGRAGLGLRRCGCRERAWRSHAGRCCSTSRAETTRRGLAVQLRRPSENRRSRRSEARGAGAGLDRSDRRQLRRPISQPAAIRRRVATLPPTVQGRWQRSCSAI